MNRKLTRSCMRACLTLAMVAGVPGFAAAQQARLYELVENLDGVTLQTTGHRISNWTAQGTADAGSPFCPLEALPPGASSCTITAFGTDDIDLTAVQQGVVNVGTVWANIVAVANQDNVVDAPEVASFSGQITGRITIQAAAPPPIEDLRHKKTMMGPSIPLIFVKNGKFFPDPGPVIRTSPPAKLPTGGFTAKFESTFRLPFTLARDGTRARAEPGKKAFYLADDGSFIRLDRQNEFALGFALVRAEVFFK